MMVTSTSRVPLGVWIHISGLFLSVLFRPAGSTVTGQWMSGHTAANTLTTLLCLVMTAVVERREHVSACQVSLLNTSLPLHPVHNASTDGPGIPSLTLQPSAPSHLLVRVLVLLS